MQELDLLILGAGWTSTFLIPLLQTSGKNLTFAATTRDGRDVAGVSTIQWSFKPESKDAHQFRALPAAKAVLITFPLAGRGPSNTLVKGYTTEHSKRRGENAKDVHFVQLGSTGIWQMPQKTVWISRKSRYDEDNKRAVAEDELLSLGGCVLNLAGLWGGARNPADWVDRVAKTKEEVRNKTSLHLVHGQDVARAVLAVISQWDLAKQQRWMVTDTFVYDWWALFVGWADRPKDGENAPAEPSLQAQWVGELLEEEKIQGLPRSMDALGRCYDGREFWTTFSELKAPLKARV